MSAATCRVPGCDGKVRCKSLCAFHYDRTIRGIDLDAPRRRPRLPLMESFTVEPDGCWLWQGSTTHYGYGRYSREGASVHAHRAVYQSLVGPIPDGLDLDHLCRVRRCVNPDHLEPVTRQVNILRSPIAGPAINAKKAECVNGHPFDATNTRVWKGVRACRACDRERKRQLRAATREAVVA